MYGDPGNPNRPPPPPSPPPVRAQPYPSLPSPGPPPRQRYGGHGRFRGDLSYGRAALRWPASAARALRSAAFPVLWLLSFAVLAAVAVAVVFLLTP
ncbi:hypothetical protein [Streptodolium elevatio]|uniref:Uncharacterized protein n=1 Tax=Streptodolium elevatio TaxID=3157996 RepID=A0ABV3DUF5_9ACTN